jgi:O-antigen/teichoic acid export membrane protein
MMSDSFVRNSGYLVGNLAFTAVCGLGAVTLLTQLYPVEAVGLSAAAVSFGGLIDITTQFGVNYSLPRFLPTSRHRTALINTVLTASMLAAFLGAVIALVLPVSAKLYALGGLVFAVVFLAGTTINVGETQLEVIFVADRSAKKLAKSNFVANLINLAAPAAFLFAGALGAYLSRIAIGMAGFILLFVMLARSGHRFRPTLSIEAIRDLRGFAVGAYAAALSGTLPLWVTPMIILTRFGPTQNAYWYTAMGIAMMLYAVPGVISRMLLAEAAHRPLERRALVRRAALLMGALTFPIFIVAYIAAPLALALLGHRYVTGSLMPLRWLILGGMVTQVNYITGNILYLAKKTLAITIMNGIDAAIVLGLAITWAHNASDVAIVWIIGDACNVVLFAVSAFAALRQVRGRWERLGGDQASTVAAEAWQPASQESQEAALDMLRSLARLQSARNVHGPGELASYQYHYRIDETDRPHGRRPPSARHPGR